MSCYFRKGSISIVFLVNLILLLFTLFASVYCSWKSLPCYLYICSISIASWLPTPCYSSHSVATISYSWQSLPCYFHTPQHQHHNPGDTHLAAVCILEYRNPTPDKSRPATSTLCSISIVFLTILASLLFKLCGISILFWIILVLLLLHSLASAKYSWKPLTRYRSHFATSVSHPWWSYLAKVALCRNPLLMTPILLLACFAALVSYSWLSLSCYCLHYVASVSYGWQPLSYYDYTP